MKDLYTINEGQLSSVQCCMGDALVEELIKSEFAGEKREANPYTDELIKMYGFEWDQLSEIGYLTFNSYASFMVEAVKLHLWKQVKEFCEQYDIPLHRVSGGDLYSMKSELMRNHVTLAEEVGMYGDGLLSVSGNQILRFSGCSNKLSLLKNAISDNALLPFGIFEISNSYRYEKEEDVALLMRNRKFHLPELHIINENLQDGLKRLLKGHEQIDSVMKKHHLDYVMLYSTTNKFITDNSWFIERLSKGCAHPPVIDIFEGETCENGIVFDVEYKACMKNGMLLEIGTLQIDEGNTGFSYGIMYKGKPISTIHAVFFASSVERTIYTYLDIAAARDDIWGLPFWLAPVHCRVFSESSGYDYDTKKIMTRMKERYRVEWDDRNIPVQNKITEALNMKIPYVIKVGKEVLMYDKNADAFLPADLDFLLTNKLDESFGLGQFSPEKLSQRVLC